MCNLYNVTTTRDAVMVFTKAVRDKAGWNEPSFDVYPNMLAPIVRIGEDGQREIVRATTLVNCLGCVSCSALGKPRA